MTWTFRRDAARAVVFDAADRVLLIRAADPVNPAKGEWWEIPGGGIDPGERSDVAAAREIYEETGLAGVEVGPSVWTHHSAFSFAGMSFDQQEYVHVARWSGTAVADPATGDYHPGHLEAAEAVAFKGVRWWRLDELGDFAAGGGKVLPPWLPVQLPLFVDGSLDGASGPIDLGDLEPVW